MKDCDEYEYSEDCLKKLRRFQHKMTQNFDFFSEKKENITRETSQNRKPYSNAPISKENFSAIK